MRSNADMRLQTEPPRPLQLLQGGRQRPLRAITCSLPLSRTRKADLDAAFVAMLAGVAEGEPKAKGVEVGKKLRPGLIELRGRPWRRRSQQLRAAHQPGVDARDYHTCLFNRLALGPSWSMTSGSQFRPAPPPALCRRQD